MKLAVALATSLMLGSLSAGAAPIDLSSWKTHNFATLSGHPDSRWVQQGNSARHVGNGQPSLLLGATPRGPMQISAEVRTTDWDDDYFGFAFGVGGGDWLLIDWKQANQRHNFSGGSASRTPATTAQRGLAASLVSGTPTADEFWGHVDLRQDNGGGLRELARGATLGSQGYARDTWYRFEFLLLADSLSVKVNDVAQFRIDGQFTDGQFGFYNFSQPSTEFRQVSASNLVPTPGALLLAATGLGLLALGRRRRA